MAKVCPAWGSSLVGLRQRLVSSGSTEASRQRRRPGSLSSKENLIQVSTRGCGFVNWYGMMWCGMVWHGVTVDSEVIISATSVVMNADSGRNWLVLFMKNYFSVGKFTFLGEKKNILSVFFLRVKNISSFLLFSFTREDEMEREHGKRKQTRKPVADRAFFWHVF